VGDIVVFDGPISIQSPGQSSYTRFWVQVETGNVVTDGGDLDGSPVFSLSHHFWTTTSTYSVGMGIGGSAGLQFVQPMPNPRGAARLGTGVLVGTPSQIWGASSVSNLISTDSGNVGIGIENGWYARGSGFIGFRFDSGGTTLHGWAELTVGGDTEGFTLERWAFDDTGASILTGQVPAPGTTGIALLALGAAGMRRSRQGSAA